MKRIRSIGVVLSALAVASLASPAYADTSAKGHGWAVSVDGNQFLELCQASEDVKVGLCEGFINGVVTGASAVVTKSCSWNIPLGMSGDQLQDIVRKGLVAHPETRNQMAFKLIIKYVGEAFPCVKL